MRIAHDPLIGSAMNTPSLLLTVVMVVALPACSRDSSPVSPSPTTPGTSTRPTWSLSGVVTERFQGVDIPVLEATVSIADGSDAGRSIATDDIGNYEFNGLEQGAFTVRATRTGYELSAQVVELTADHTLDFALRRVSQSVTFAFDGDIGPSDFGTGIPRGARVSGTFTISANTRPTTPSREDPSNPNRVDYFGVSVEFTVTSSQGSESVSGNDPSTSYISIANGPPFGDSYSVIVRGGFSAGRIAGVLIDQFIWVVSAPESLFGNTSLPLSAFSLDRLGSRLCIGDCFRGEILEGDIDSWSVRP